MIVVYIIISCSVAGWAGFLYRNSLRTKAGRHHFLYALGRLLLFFPLGLQGILLFVTGIFSLLPFEGAAGLLAGKQQTLLDPFDPLPVLKFITGGSFLLALNLFLVSRTRDIKKDFAGALLQLLIFASGCLLAGILLVNIFPADFFPSWVMLFQFGNLLLILSLAAIMIVSFSPAALLEKNSRTGLKYFVLTAKALRLYIIVLLIKTGIAVFIHALFPV